MFFSFFLLLNRFAKKIIPASGDYFELYKQLFLVLQSKLSLMYVLITHHEVLVQTKYFWGA